MSNELERTGRPARLARGELDLLAASAQARNVALWHVLTVERRLPEDAVASALCESLGFTRVRLDAVPIQPEALKVLTPLVARKYVCLPLQLTDSNVVLAMANPQDVYAIDAVQAAADRRVQPVVATRREILKGIATHYAQVSPGPRASADTELTLAGGDDAVDLDQDEASQPPEAAAIVAVCHQILFAAVKLDASDVHIEPGPAGVRVRLRVDGMLRDYLDLPAWMQRQLLSRIKVLAHLDIAQQRLPQDGRIKARSREGAIDLRVSTLPTQYGEKIVLRVLGSSHAPSMLDLGLADVQLAVVDEALHQPQGLILVTGPTGSGKSTTLYSMLTRRQAPDVNVVTVEDPIERRLPGITQSQVNDKAGTTFARYLRAILRQDPDVIMIGEIRDLESAEIAFQAALTGHLVLTTLHTNGTIEAIDRLRDIGVKPLMITSVTNLVVAQRLARLTCPHCRARYLPSAAALRKLGLDASGEFTRGRGCPSCGHTGYRGRIGIFELLRLTPALKDLIRGGAGEAELRAAAAAGGTQWLSDDAAAKITQGLTTVEEVLRVVRIDDAGAPPHAIVRRRG
ncbi:MAG TPA: GspE/PulE family protein [Vicinamibacterales bacterium]